MSAYLLIDLLILVVPVAMTCDRRIRYYSKLPALLPAIFIVGSMFLFWDVVATGRGDWGFNPRYLIGKYFLNIPVEEMLFFIVTPYSCLFIYEALQVFQKEQRLNISRWPVLGGILIFFLAAWLSRGHDYSQAVLLTVALFLISEELMSKEILRSRNYWLFILISFIPFVASNLALTALPIVWYNPQAIWGPRFFSIPAEDVLYSYAMLSFYFLFYQFFGGKLSALKQGRFSSNDAGV